MRNSFGTSASRPSAAEQALKAWNIAYTKKPDGSIFVPGDLNISSKNLTRLPDLSAVDVGGGFFCGNNRLTSLKGAPRSVGGRFACSANRLVSLRGAPQFVGGDFFCTINRLTSLRGAPQQIGGDFCCCSNQLTSLKYAPQTDKDVFCTGNQLTSLEHAPQDFNRLESDFGSFAVWELVPEHLQTSPKTRARQTRRRAVVAEKALVTGATVLRAPVAIHRPLRLKRQPASP